MTGTPGFPHVEEGDETMATSRRQFVLGGLATIALPIIPGSIAVAMADEGAETVRFAIQKPAGDLNPHIYSGLWGVQDLIFEPLVKYGRGGTFEPGLATAWEIEDDGKRLRLRLREGVTFHDGTPWNADALKWNFDRWIRLDDHSWINFARLFDGLTIVDPHTVEIAFKEAPLGLMFELSYVRPVRFLSPASVADDGTYRDPVGTGPWNLVSSDSAESVLERYPDYWGPKPAFERLEMKVLPDSRNRMAALRAGEIDVTGGDFLAPINATEAKTLKEAGVAVEIAPGSTTMILGFNPDRSKALADDRVRKAISLGFDRNAVSTVLFAGFAQPAGSIFIGSVPLAGTQFDADKRDVAEAKRLLDEAGWTGSPLRSKDGEDLSIELVVSEEQIIGSRSVAEVMQAQLKEIGIDLTIRSVDHASRHSDIPARKYDLAFFLTFGAPYDPYGTVVSYFLSTYDNGVDGKLYTDAEILDPLLLSAMGASMADSEKALQAVYDWLHENTAIAPVLFLPSIWAHSERVESFEPPATEYDTPYEKISVNRS